MLKKATWNIATLMTMKNPTNTLIQIENLNRYQYLFPFF